MKKQLYIIDGYNMIGAWPHLTKLKNEDRLETARNQLLDECSNFSKFEQIEVWIVFDAQFVPGIQTSFDEYQVKVIYTAEGETADSYIERIVEEKNTIWVQVSVATSDLAEQWLVFQKGALRKSAREFYQEIQRSKKRQAEYSRSFSQQGRRRSPWSEAQLHQLDELRFRLMKKTK